MNAGDEVPDPPAERHGLAASRGFADGPTFLYCGARELVAPEYEIAEADVIGELARYHSARAEAKRQIESLVAKAREDGASGEGANVFDNHLAMLDDPSVVALVEKNVRSRLNAEAAVRRAVGVFRAAFGKMDDPYLRERLRDVDDVERRMLHALMGGEETALSQISRPSVIVADDLTPSETVAMPRHLVLGIATDRGSSTSHVALLARALGIPAVVGLGDATRSVRAGDRVLLDGARGLFMARPSAAAADAFHRHAERGRAIERALAETRNDPGVMKDGTPLKLVANLQPGVPFESLAEFGARGVGLYRTEYLWMEGDRAPDEETQFAAYSQAVKAALPTMGPEARITFRCLDLGGDKLMRGVKSAEPNPFLGYRSIRWLLGHRDAFRTQLRAILRASAFGKAAVMFPMIATLSELREANAELANAMAELRREGTAFDSEIMRGAMIETPAAALVADQLADEVDFFSIGTNDLVQYTLAADRGNERVAYLSKASDPAVVRLVDLVCRSAAAGGIYACICGEAASDPVFAPLWAGLGVKVLSMSASGIPVVKAALRSVTIGEAREFAQETLKLCASLTADGIRARCREFVAAKAPDLPL